MDSSSKTRATVSVLSIAHLSQILLYIPLLETIKLREVCKTWRQAVDNIWSSITNLSINYNISATVFYTDTTIEISTENPTLARGLVSRCGDSLRCLEVGNNDNPDVSCTILSEALEKCRQLEELVVYVKTEADGEQLGSLLRLNPRINSLSIHLQSGRFHRFFEDIPKDIEKLEICVSRDGCRARTYEELLLNRESFLSNNADVIENLVRVIRDSAKLKKLVLNYSPQRVLEVVSEKKDLRELTLLHSGMDDAFSFVPTEGIPTKWSYIFKLSNLRDLRMYATWARGINPHLQLVTDDFVEGLVQHCPLLEAVTLHDFMHLTDRSVHALSSLRLKTLSLPNLTSTAAITDRYLMDFVSIEELNVRGHENVRDAGVIALLERCETIQFLDLYRTGITRETLVAAVEQTKGRTSGLRLDMLTGIGEADFSEDENTSPLLNIFRM